MRLSPFSAQDFAAISTLGLEFAVAVALGIAGGYWIDSHYQTTPWGTIGGVVVGFALGMYILVRRAQQMAQPPNTGKKK